MEVRCENGGKEASNLTAVDVSEQESGGPADGCGLEDVWLDVESVKKHRAVDERRAKVEMSALKLAGVKRLLIRRRVEEGDSSANAGTVKSV